MVRNSSSSYSVNSPCPYARGIYLIGLVPNYKYGFSRSGPIRSEAGNFDHIDSIGHSEIPDAFAGVPLAPLLEGDLAP